MATSPTPISALPTAPSTTDQANFDAEADAFIGSLPAFRTQANALATNVYDNAVVAEQAAVTAEVAVDVALQIAGATMWNAATNYATGSAVISPSNLRTYRRVAPGGIDASDPASAPSLWTLLSPAGVFASQAQNAAGTAEGLAVDPLGIREAFNAAGAAPVYAVRAWVVFDGYTGTVRGSGNVTGVTRIGAGRYTVVLAVDAPSQNYGIQVSTSNPTNGAFSAASYARSVSYAVKQAGSVDICTVDGTAAGPDDMWEVSVAFIW